MIEFLQIIRVMIPRSSVPVTALSSIKDFSKFNYIKKSSCPYNKLQNENKVEMPN